MVRCIISKCRGSFHLKHIECIQECHSPTMNRKKFHILLKTELLFHHKTFTVACDGPKDYACDDELLGMKFAWRYENPQEFPAI